MQWLIGLLITVVFLGIFGFLCLVSYAINEMERQEQRQFEDENWY